MRDYEWLASLPGFYAAVLATLVFRRQRKQSRGVRWTVEATKGERSPTEFVITNQGFDTARGVMVELDPPQRRMNAGWNTARDVEVGGRVRLTFRRMASTPQVSRVTVRWRTNLLSRKRQWSTDV